MERDFACELFRALEEWLLLFSERSQDQVGWFDPNYYAKIREPDILRLLDVR